MDLFLDALAENTSIKELERIAQLNLNPRALILFLQVDVIWGMFNGSFRHSFETLMPHNLHVTHAPIMCTS